MQVVIGKKFFKDLDSLPNNRQAQVAKFVFELLPNLKTIQAGGIVEKLSGYKGYYKIRFGDYRLGIYSDSTITKVITVMHRKEIYRYFP